MQLCPQASRGVQADQQHSLQQVEGGGSCTYSVHSPRATEHWAVRVAKQVGTQPRGHLDLEKGQVIMHKEPIGLPLSPNLRKSEDGHQQNTDLQDVLLEQEH